jgi:hypothetical protein
MKMSELGLVEYFSMAEALGIIATMFIVLYFSRKQTQALSVDIETKVLNDLNEKMQALTKTAIERPELIKIISNVQMNWSAELGYAYDILNTFAFVFQMHQRKVLSDNEWTGWLRWMKSIFERGRIKEYWEINLEVERWFDPAFEEFINKELIPAIAKKIIVC